MARTRGGRSRRRTVGLLVGSGVVVVLVAGVIVADVALRAYAEDRVETELASSLPANVEGDVAVEIGGFSFLEQYLSGSFDTVTLDAPGLIVDGSPVAAHVTASGVPTDLSKPVEKLAASLTLDQNAVNSFVTVPGSATITLDDADAVGYDGSVSFLGLGVDYRVTAGVSVTPDSVVLTPTSATLSNGSSSVDLSGALRSIIDQPLPLCVADQLPRGLELAGLQVTAGRAVVDVVARDFTLDAQNLETKGECP